MGKEVFGKSGKSKWFARFISLALGLTFLVGGIFGLVHITQNNNESEKAYAWTIFDAASRTPGNLSVRQAGFINLPGSAPNPQLTWHYLVTRWEHVGGDTTELVGRWESVVISNQFNGRAGYIFTGIQVLANGVVIHTDTALPTSGSPRNTLLLNSIAATNLAGRHILRVEANWRHYDNYVFQRNETFTSTALTWDRAGTLATPSGVSVSGSTLSWNGMSEALGFQIRVGNTVVRNVGAGVTSYNLASIPVGVPGQAAALNRMPVGAHSNINVVATHTGAAVNDSAASANVSWTRTGTLATPSVSISGSTLSWGAVTSATGYQIRRGTTVIRTLGAVTSYNLANIPAADLAVATNHTNINVVAISSASYLANSAASANRTWARRGTLATPSDVFVSGNTLGWTHGRANTTHFEIRLGASVVATVPVGSANAHTFDLRRLPATHATGTQLGSYRALAVGPHSLTIVARNTTAGTLWDNSAASSAVTYDRAGRVDSIVISAASSNLIIEWPRPVSVGDMPSIQLSAAVSALYGTDRTVTWSSTNPSIASVDTLSGFVRATWSENMWEHRIANNNRFTVIRATSVFDGNVVGEFRVYVVFNDPPGAVTIGVNVSGGARELELAPCGTMLAAGGSLTNATQFSAVAYGYNLAGAGNTFAWASSDTGVATIDSEGRLSVRGIGVVRITATSSVGGVPYAFYVTIARDGTALATNVTVFCDNDRSDERRMVRAYAYGAAAPFVELRAHIEGHNITSQLVTWTSSCGASLGNPSLFLEFAPTSDGVRVTGLLQGGPFIITATPVHAIGAVGTFRIFVDQSVAPSVTHISVSVPSVSELVVPNVRPILTTDLPTAQLTATTIGGVGGGTNSAVVWTSSCGARAGVGIESIVGEFVYLIVSGVNPNSVSVRARDRGVAGFSQAVTITATSTITPSQFASRQITVSQGAISGIEITTAVGGLASGTLVIPYGETNVSERTTLDLRAQVSISHASISGAVRWVVCTPNVVVLYNIRSTGALTSLVTLRPLEAGEFTITAVGVYCGTVSSKFALTIEQEGATSIRIIGPNDVVFSYEMHISLPRPDTINLPTLDLVARVGGRVAAGSSLVWTSSCGGGVIQFLSGDTGNSALIRGIGAGVAIIRVTHTGNGFYANFTISVTKSSLDSIEILGDNVVREQTAMLIPLVYENGVYTLSDVINRQSLQLSLIVKTSGDVATNFIWTSSDESVIRLSADLTDRNGFVTALPYGVGTAIIRAVSTIDPTFYATFTIFVTRGTASCSIQDGILDLPSLQTGDVRIILICEHYFGTARMSHQDMTLEQAQNFTLPVLTLDIQGAIFHGWSLSRGGSLLSSENGNGTGNENENGENGNMGNLPLHLLDIENGADTLLLFAVWYIPYAENGNGSNLARNIIIGTLSVAGVGAAGTAGYIAQYKIRARRKENIDEWTMD